MTDEYLDRSSLVARMKYYEEHTTEGSGEHYAYSTALREIRNAPAADVAPVVRCRDCEYARDLGFKFGSLVHESWFCIYNGPTPQAQMIFVATGKNERKEKLKMILDILNLLALIEWIALGVVVWLKARSLYRRSKAVLDALQSEETEVCEDDAETLL